MNKLRNSIKMRIRVLFIVLMTTSIAVVGAIVFYHWKVAIDKVIVQVQNETNSDIFDTIENFVTVPPMLNGINQHMISNEIVDIHDEKKREAFFAGVMKAVGENVYSFSYGTEQGEYYGARRNKNNRIELMRSDAKTGGRSQYYSVTNDLTAGELVEKLGKFDPRTRDWYILAKEARKPIFSPVYKHFAMDDLAISASYPIYDKQEVLRGVLGTHITLSKINEYLKNVVKDKNATAYIVERQSGELVGNSLAMPNFEMGSASSARRVNIEGIGKKEIAGAYLAYKKNGRNYSVVNTENRNLHIEITEFKISGLDWLIITAVSDSDYAEEMNNTIFMAVLLSIMAIMGTIIVWTKSLDQYFKPVYSLIRTQEKFSRGDLSQRATIYRTDEIGKLANAFNEMAENISVLINELEEKVTERTSQLSAANEKLELQSQIDFLTNLRNRRFILGEIEQEIKRVARSSKTFSIIMGDIDHFKMINDTYGHDCGDLILKEIASILQMLARETDCVSRWGGEEFLVLLPETEVEGALKLAEKFRQTVAEKEFCYQSLPLKVTMTFGVAAYEDGIGSDEVIKHADMALYRGKNDGRNRVKSLDA